MHGHLLYFLLTGLDTQASEGNRDAGNNGHTVKVSPSLNLGKN